MRAFLLAFVAGVGAVLLLSLAYPYPEQVRYRSLSNAIPNGGSVENFSIELPGDRLMPALDAELNAPGTTDVRAELFRVRDDQKRVIGIAGKLTGSTAAVDADSSSVSDWTLVISGRGALFLTQRNGASLTPGRTELTDGLLPLELNDQRGMSNAAEHLGSGGPEGATAGRVIGGTGEFAGLAGSYDEVWQVESVSAVDEMAGRIVLTARIVRSD